MINKILRNTSLVRNNLKKIKALESEIAQLQQECQNLEKKLSQSDYLPVPPQHLRVRVGGWEETDHFLGVGRKVFWDLTKQLRRIDKNISSFNNIFDFGCGCGRVLRFLNPTEGQRIVGSDIDSESISWCQQNLGEKSSFVINNDLPPLPFANETFDFIYSISVFTHLPENMQFKWLEELYRVLTTDGIFITTTHGKSLLPPELPLETYKQFEKKGFYYSIGNGTEGLPDYYHTSFHNHEYIHKYWSQYFRIHHIQSRGINNHQDAVVCQKK